METHTLPESAGVCGQSPHSADILRTKKPAKGAHPQTIFVPPEPGYFGTPTTPDYGEPWQPMGDDEIWSDNEDEGTLAVANGCIRERIVACVNACAGMADPAKEIANLRDYAGRTHELATKVSIVVAQREAKQEELEAMREAIKEAHAALAKASDLLSRAGIEQGTTWEPGQSWIFWEDKCSAKNDVESVRNALTKLQPFTTP